MMLLMTSFNNPPIENALLCPPVPSDQHALMSTAALILPILVAGTNKMRIRLPAQGYKNFWLPTRNP